MAEGGETQSDANGEKRPAKSKKKAGVSAAVGKGAILSTLGVFSLGAGWVAALGPDGAADALSALRAPEQSVSDQAPTYIELDEIIANLSVKRTPHFIRTTLVLRVPYDKREHVLSLKPQLLDALQEYIRQQHPSDLQGGAGFYRFKSECLYRIRLLAGNENVEDLYVTSLMTQ